MALLLNLACHSRASEEQVLAFERRGSVTVLTQSGEKVDSLTAGKTSDGRWRFGYFAPDVNPDGSTVAVVRCFLTLESGAYQIDREGCSLLARSLRSGEEQLLLTGQTLDSPSWHPSKNQVALFREREVLVLDTDSRKILTRATILPRIRVAGSEVGFDTKPSLHFTHRPYIVWSETAERLLIVTTARIGSLTLHTSNFEWLKLPVPDFLRGRQEYSEFNTVGRPRPQLTQPDHPVYEAVFGAPEHRVWNPTFSPDGRYYFYAAYREGLGARHWIEAYDRERKKTFSVRTLWWYPYWL